MNHLDLNDFVPLLQKVSGQYHRGVARVLASLDGHPLHGDPDENYARLLELLDTSSDQARQPPQIGFNAFNDPYVMFSGRSLLGATECERLTGLGYRIGQSAYHVMTQKGLGCYDWDHRLVPGKRYSLAFRQWPEEVEKGRLHQVSTIRRWLHENNCPQDGLLAGMVPQLCEAVGSSKRMCDEWGINYLVLLHKPLRTRGGDTYFLGVLADGEKPQIEAFPATESCTWSGKGAFAYVAEMRAL